MIQDRVLSPYIVQTAVYSAMDATERTLGLASYSLRGGVEFVNGAPPLKLDNTYAGDFNVPLQASTGVASPLASILGAGFDALKIKSINLEIEASERKRLAASGPGDGVAQASSSGRFGGAERHVHRRKRRWKCRRASAIACLWARRPACLSFTVSDGSMSNALDYQQMAAGSAQERHAAGLVPEQSPSQHQRLRARVAHRSGVPGSRPGFAGSAAFGGPDPRQSASGAGRVGAARFQNR